MEKFLKEEILKKVGEHPEVYTFDYEEDIIEDVNNFLINNTSWIYKVGVLTAIDEDKCDFVHIVIGTQLTEISEPELKGYFYFSEGENDDMGRVLKRFSELIKVMHPAFRFK